MHILSAFMILLTDDLHTAFAANFFAGIAMAGRVFVGYVWMTENMPTDKVPMATSTLFACDSSNLVWVSIYFRYVSRNWIYVYSIPIFVLTLNTLYFLFFEYDSPKYYFSKGDLENAKIVLEHIGKVNGIDKKIVFVATEKEGDGLGRQIGDGTDSEGRS